MVIILKKKKILIASYNLDFGGIETSLINLLKNFNYNKYDVTLYLEEKKGVFLNDLPSSVNVYEYKVSKSKNKLIRKAMNLANRLFFIFKNYKRYDASICYATYSKPCSFMARVSSDNRILFVHNDYTSIYDNENLIHFFTGINIKKFNHIVFVSNESRESLIKIIPDIDSKSITINNLVDQDRIIKLSKEKIKILKNKKKIFLFVGRLDEHQKKISRIIDCANVLKNDNEIEFWILGTGEDEKKYKDMIKRFNLSNVKLLGAAKNPYPYIAKSDYLIITSDYEGFPVVYSESIILNTPIVTTINVSDDYISIPNRFGIIVNKDINDISLEIRKLVKNGFKIKEKVDYNLLNKQRIEKIEKIMENRND